ncbi:hypothetical protein SNEBB_000027 [Seison nebaliae]|nr:hypothetical protein SNEBB_000027 [Seison nebaliae]
MLKLFFPIFLCVVTSDAFFFQFLPFFNCNYKRATYKHGDLVTKKDCITCQCKYGSLQNCRNTCGDPSPPPESCGYNSICPAIYNPICGSDDITYANTCAFERTRCDNWRLTIKHKGQCQKKENCRQACNKMLDRKCGSNGVNYANGCLLEVAICEDPSIYLAHNGPC